MEINRDFNLHEYIHNWSQNLKHQPSFTVSDVEELKSHFLDCIDDLKAKGLDEEEACYIASRRMGSSFEWEDDFMQVNNSVNQLKKSVVLLSGAVGYFFFYYMILFVSELLLFILLISGVDGFEAIGWTNRYLVSIQFVMVVSTISIYFLEDRAIRHLNKIEFTTKRVIYFLMVTFLTGALSILFLPIIKNLIADINLRGYLIKYYQYFDYTFPVLVFICFLSLYLKFSRKNRC